ncbi:MAG TPA: VCBS repeat-containing protein, partial [Bacteroidia bacterium]
MKKIILSIATFVFALNVNAQNLCFTSAVGSPFAAGTQPYSTISADFNMDGKPDLATANSGSNDVTVLLGTGTGSFTPAGSSPFGLGGTTPYSIISGDFNKDGKPDLATANNASNDVSILLGDGLGGFSASTEFPAGSRVYSV